MRLLLNRFPTSETTRLAVSTRRLFLALCGQCHSLFGALDEGIH
jgi:hypothetical protein